MSLLRSRIHFAIAIICAAFLAASSAKAQQPDLRVSKGDNIGGTLTLGGTPVTNPSCSDGKTCWIWTLTISNVSSTTAAVFAQGATILTDTLPIGTVLTPSTPSIAYGTNPPPATPPTPPLPSPLPSVTPTVGNFSAGITSPTRTLLQSSCTMAPSGSNYTLSCVVPSGTGSVNLPPGSSFSISFSAFPNIIGSYQNPPDGGLCEVDPNNTAETTPPAQHPLGKFCNEGVAADVEVDQADLTVTKKDDVNHASANGSWNWILTITNGGGRIASFGDTQVILTDTLPNGAPDSPGPVTYGSPIVTPDTGINSIGENGTVSCTTNFPTTPTVMTCTAVGTVLMAAGQKAFEVSIPSSTTTPGTYTNPDGTCKVDPNNFIPEEINLSSPAGSRETNNTCIPDPVTFGPDLTATKTNDAPLVNSVPTVVLGSSFDWTITIANTGPTQAVFTSGDIILTDNLPADGFYTLTTPNPFTNVSCSIDVSNTLTCMATSTPTVIPSNAQFPVMILATPTDLGIAGAFTNPANGGTCAVDPANKINEISESNNNCSNTVMVIAPDLQAAKTHSPTSPAVNAPFTWTITLGNFGSASAQFTAGQTILTDTLPNTNITYGSTVTVGNCINFTDQTTLQNSCSFTSANVLTCKVPTNPSGQSVTFAVGARCDIGITATATKAQAFTNPTGGTCAVDPLNEVPDGNLSNNACGPDTVTPVSPTLSAVKTDNVNHAPTLNVPFTWKITVSNTAQSQAAAIFTAGQVILTDNLPSTNITYGSTVTVNNFTGGISGTDQTTLQTGTCSIAANVVTCTVPSGKTVTLPIGSSFDVNITATVTAAGALTNPAAGGVCEVDPGNALESANSSKNCTDNITPLIPALSAVKTDSVNHVPALNVPFTWKITISNTAGSPSSAVFTSGQTIFTDTLPTTNITYGSTVTVNNFTGTISAGDQTTLQSSCGISANVVTCVVPSGQTVTLPINSSFDVSFNATITGMGTLVNPTGGVCQVDPNNVLEAPNTSKNCTDSVTPGTPTLTAVKTDSVNHAPTLNVPFTWKITVSNTAQSPVTAVFTAGQTILTDTLPTTNITYGSTVTVTSATLAAGDLTTLQSACGIAGNLVTCIVPSGKTVTLPIGSSFDVSFSATVTAMGSVTNPTGGVCQVDPGNVLESPNAAKNCTDTVTPPTPTLTATKTDNVNHGPTINVPFTWKITIANPGSSPVSATFTAGQTIFTDTLPTTNITYGATVTVNNFVGTISGTDQATLMSACGIAGNLVTCIVPSGKTVTLPIGSSFDVSFSATVTAAGTLTNPTGGVCQVDPGNVLEQPTTGKNCSDTITPLTPTLTAIKLNDTGGAGKVGVPYHWSIVVADSGASAAFTNGQVLLKDNLPSGPTYGATTETQTAGVTGTILCSITSGTLTCTASGAVTITAGSSFTVSFPVTPVTNGTLVNPAAGGVCQVDPDNHFPSPNKNCHDTVTVGTLVLPPTIVKSFFSDTVAAGGTVTITFTINNPNPSASLTGIGFTDTLPTGFTVSSGPTTTCPGGTATAPTTTSIKLAGAHLAGGASCTVSVVAMAPNVPDGTRLCDTTSFITSNEGGKGLPATACISIGTVVLPADVFLINYVSHLENDTNNNASVVNITNSGTTDGVDPFGNICVNVYAFSPDEQMVSCCSCLVSPNGLQSLSVNGDLLINRLTPGTAPDSIVIKLLATTPVAGVCDPASPTNQTLIQGTRAWATTIHQLPSSGFMVEDRKFQPGGLSQAELNHITSFCGFIEDNGSGYGICNSCRSGALLGNKSAQ